jgi:RND superfamily putative drug exporter
MRAVARWCFVHRRLVLVGWLAALIGLSALTQVVGTGYKDSFKLKGTESADAYNLLSAAAPTAAGDLDRVVIAVDHGKVTDAAVRDRVEPVLAQVAKLPHVASVVSPFTAAGSRQVAPDGQIAFATVQFDVQAIDVSQGAAKDFVNVARSAASDGVQVEVGGQVAQLANRTHMSGTGIGILAAAIVLFLVFGSLLAAALPLITALVSLGTGIALVGLLSHAMSVASFSSELSTLIGLGVGVDYALFIVTRYRQQLLRGATPQDAVVKAVDTSGRAVLFAGMTVCIALLGLFALGVSFLYGIALAATLAVALTVVASLTLLPALLGFFKFKVLPRRERRRIAAGEFADSDESPWWGRWARMVQKRPAVFAAAAGVLLVLIALPFFSLRLGNSDQGNDPKGSTTREAYDLLAKGFGPGFNGPLQLITPVHSAADRSAFSTVVNAVENAPGVAATTVPQFLPGRNGQPTIGLATVYPTGSPQDESTVQLIHRLRDTTIPQALHSDQAGAQTKVYVAGLTAIFVDFSHVLAGKLPFFIGVVVLLSFLLLTIVFRSLVIPTTAAVMNLLSIGAALGAVVAVFQWGHGAHLMGVGKGGPVEAFVPVMMFAILFGLSMDYQVFLVSRIYEEWHHRRDNREAITHGLAATGRTITAAGAIMILVFAAFILGDNRVIKLFGFGLAVAVLFDAFIVRSVIVPGLMHVFGESNWKLPRALDRVLPHVNVEGRAEVPADLAGYDEDLLEPAGRR